MAEEWTELKGRGYWEPVKEGDELVGKVVEVKEGIYGLQHTVEKANGERITTPSWKVLQARLVDVEVGETVRIVYKGQEAPKLKGYKPTMLFEVYLKTKA